MALKDKWVDRIDGVDIASANDINQVAQAVIELEETGGGNGADGKSAYDIAVINGFEGTEAEWLESLKGEDGAAGTRFIAQAEKPSETDVLWLDTDDDLEAPGGEGGTAQPMEKLTFTGAVEAEYDGSKPVTVEIPQGGGGGGAWERICDFSTSEVVSSFAVPLTEDAKKKCNDVNRIKIALKVTRDSSDTTTSTEGTVDVYFDIGIKEKILVSAKLIPAPTTTYIGYKTLLGVFELSGITEDNSMGVINPFNGLLNINNQSPQTFSSTRLFSIKGRMSNTTRIGVDGSQNMGKGTRLIVEVM